MSSYSRYAEALGRVNAPVATLFDFLDDQSNLSAHMSKPSGMMLGSTMEIYMDADRTRRVGSKFGFSGRLLGVPLAVAEVVIARDPPISKRWETMTEPRLWVIGRYEMGFRLTPERDGTRLQVDISYDLPARGLPRALGLLFGGIYAHWCTRQMVSDARAHFAHPGLARAS
ncbi:SRPBCC family protein [Devosia nitrariae]|uniref:Polyketide cyclase n=1 Tax=Devosia nitrariae TaxID=2071872 RepID=A0ABQ5WA62_9HYPH|nr:SRPBCC family protein [Devosia nitrariae]GLQ56618.1 polyketide cyclase [Devosia nitrariae]